MRERSSSGIGKIVAGLVLLGTGAVIGAYNSDAVKETTSGIAVKAKEIAKNANEKYIEIEHKSLPYMPGPLKKVWNWFGNIHHEQQYDTLEQRYEANRQKREQDYQR